MLRLNFINKLTIYESYVLAIIYNGNPKFYKELHKLLPLKETEKSLKAKGLLLDITSSGSMPVISKAGYTMLKSPVVKTENKPINTTQLQDVASWIERYYPKKVVNTILYSVHAIYGSILSSLNNLVKAEPSAMDTLTKATEADIKRAIFSYCNIENTTSTVSKSIVTCNKFIFNKDTRNSVLLLELRNSVKIPDTVKGIYGGEKFEDV